MVDPGLGPFQLTSECLHLSGKRILLRCQIGSFDQQITAFILEFGSLVVQPVQVVGNALQSVFEIDNLITCLLQGIGRIAATLVGGRTGMFETLQISFKSSDASVVFTDRGLQVLHLHTS